MEGISKIYNHVSKSFYFGYKLLVAGYWNGSIFVPIDFSLHRESKKSKLKYGLKAKERKAQITITMTQYLLTSIRYRMEAYETIGGLFKDLKQNYIENKLNIRILAVINSTLTVLEKFVDSIDIKSITARIIENIEDFGFLTKTYKFKCQPVV